MKKVTDLKENEGILCTTEAEATAICKLMHEAGLRWSNGRTYIERTYSVAGGLPIIYTPNDGKYMMRSSAGVISYPASDFLTPEPAPVTKPRLIDFLKVGDKVWSILHGECIVTELDSKAYNSIGVRQVPSNRLWHYKSDGKFEDEDILPIIHLTEWHPERGEPMPALPDPNEPRVGEVCLFWDNEDDKAITIGILKEIVAISIYPYSCIGANDYKNCYPLRGDKMPNWDSIINGGNR